jgi:signal transduction histidine kinase
VTVAGTALGGDDYNGTSPIQQFFIVLFFVLLLALSRRGYHRFVAYVFITIFYLLATWPTVSWGILLPQGILTYSLVIVMTGVLLSSRAAFFITGIMTATLFLINHLEDAGAIRYNTSWMTTTGGYSDVIAYGITFVIIALVAWLSNGEIERSLARARRSEQALLKERQLLERKVKERTKALEKAHVEKLLDLQHFAEFGQLSSTLLHELANPLTAVSIDLERLEGQNRSELISRAREGIAHMEKYVEAARRQLRNQSEIKLFSVAAEVERVVGFLRAKARIQHVAIKLDLLGGVNLKGDSIRFNHIISNLLTNAIDAYDDVTTDKEKIVEIKMTRQGQNIEIVVCDHGSGIAEDELPHLFEPFYTTKGTVRGTGIGLAITKQAVEESFQGTIAASYNIKQGTRFAVRLPLI